MTSARLLFCLSLWRSVASLQQQQLVIYGLGNVGRAVAKEAPTDWIVKGTSRGSPQDDVSIPFADASAYLADATHVLVTIPPTTPDISSSILSDLSAHLTPSTSWVGFVSTSGVYGNHDGAWVNEDAPLLCSSSALKYVDFEQELRDLADAQGWNACVFRCGGLYGPTRSALHTLWKRGMPLSSTTTSADTSTASTADAFITNRIHERDVARAIVGAMCKKDCSGVYNLSDNEPEAREVVMDYAAQLFAANDMTVPERSSQDDESPRKTKRGERRKKERKLVDNRKVKADVLDQFLYPTYREGLDAIFADKSTPWWNGMAE